MSQGDRVERPHWGWWVAVVGGMGAFGAVGHHRAANRWWARHTTEAVPAWLYRLGFWVAVLEHVRKAAIAGRLAREAGLHQSTPAWMTQTLVLGHPSLTLLRARVAREAPTARTGERTRYR